MGLDAFTSALSAEMAPYESGKTGSDRVCGPLDRFCTIFELLPQRTRRNVTLAGSTDRLPEAVASRLTSASAVYYKTKDVRAQSRKLQKTLTEKGMHDGNQFKAGDQ